MKKKLKTVGIIIILLFSLSKASSGNEKKFRHVILKPVANANYISSSNITVQAWKALGRKDFKKAASYADDCIKRFAKKALKQQASLSNYAIGKKAFNYWALNDVGACMFIKSKTLCSQGRTREAEKVLQEIIDKYSYAQCWDPRGWFWKVSKSAKDLMTCIELGIDYGDYTSEILTKRAWDALGVGKYRSVAVYVKKCKELYEKQASMMQGSLNNFAKNDTEFKYWALNDTATSLFILGRAYYIQGKDKKAKRVFQEIIDKYSYAQCWDPRGWFWKVSEGAKDQLLIMNTGLDYGDYTSETLTVRAWNALENGDYDAVDIFTRKCIQLYQKSALKMQEKLVNYPQWKKAFNFWALNDIGTCYFIIGEAEMSKGRYEKALQAYKTVIRSYDFAQCWDQRGWFWKPAVSARKRINRIVKVQNINDIASVALEKERTSD
ncbi:MAG: tetratricopeptide repeat protein [Candidatus Aureabacteria bacterium]|nr:tetratricopeptide repeat protein [Candidatus Auribacterota bacterium]